MGIFRAMLVYQRVCKLLISGKEYTFEVANLYFQSTSRGIPIYFIKKAHLFRQKKPSETSPTDRCPRRSPPGKAWGETKTQTIMGT